MFSIFNNNKNWQDNEYFDEVMKSEHMMYIANFHWYIFVPGLLLYLISIALFIVNDLLWFISIILFFAVTGNL